MSIIAQDIPQIYPFELKGKTIADVYETAANCVVVEFTDGTAIRFFSGDEIEIKKV